jgi:hypothetical protein
LRSLDRRFDIAIVCNSTAQEHVPLFSIRQKAMADFIFVWTFDNHHAKWSTLAINTLGDAVIPAHAFDAAYMKSPATILGRHVPFGTGQWSRASAAQLFQDGMNENRLDSLQGSFVRHSGAGDARYRLASSLKDGIPGNAIEIVVDPASYFDEGPKERWQSWARYKVGLVLPVRSDLPIRFFDSLITGQVPIVPTWCKDFDAVIPADMQAELPVVRVAEQSVGAIEEAWRKALTLFDREGVAGVRRRHRFAIEQHHIASRIEPICTQVLDISTGKGVCLDMDGTSVGFVLH